MTWARIYTVHHFVPSVWLENSLFAPVVVKVPAPEGMLGQHPDAAGDGYGDMRAHYAIWRALDPSLDYIGVQQYRRYFGLWRDNGVGDTSKSVPEEEFSRYRNALQNMTAEEIALSCHKLERADIFIPRRLNFDMAAQYCSAHVPEHWRVFTEEWERISGPVPRLQHLVPCNMFIMRRHLFVEYMEVWWSLMRRFAARVAPPADAYQRHVYGFVSERLFTLWLARRLTQASPPRVEEVPLVECLSIRTGYG